jgi:cytochrome c-type biogenesis protein CcmH
MASRIPFVMIGPRALPSRALAISFTVFFLLLLTTSGCIREEDITLEQRAHQLAGELMCPVCDGQTIDGSNAQISIDMRLKVRELLNAGDTNAEVKDYFVVRYGQEILAAPESSGFNLLAYIVPVFIVLGGIGIALITIKNMRKSAAQANSSNGQTESTSNNPDDLSNYLAQVDRDLGISIEPSPSESSDLSSSQIDSDKENS